jgi:hypothetical protein
LFSSNRPQVELEGGESSVDAGSFKDSGVFEANFDFSDKGRI